MWGGSGREYTVIVTVNKSYQNGSLASGSGEKGVVDVIEAGRVVQRSLAQVAAVLKRDIIVVVMR